MAQAMISETYVTCEEAASIIGVTTGRIRQMCRANEIAAKKAGKFLWLIPIHALDKHKKKDRKVGRPRTGERDPEKKS